MTELENIVEMMLRSPSVERRRQSDCVHYECRNCGTTLSAIDTACTACGADDIASISLR